MSSKSRGKRVRIKWKGVLLIFLLIGTPIFIYKGVRESKLLLVNNINEEYINTIINNKYLVKRVALDGDILHINILGEPNNMETNTILKKIYKNINKKSLKNKYIKINFFSDEKSVNKINNTLYDNGIVRKLSFNCDNKDLITTDFKVSEINIEKEYKAVEKKEITDKVKKIIINGDEGYQKLFKVQSIDHVISELEE